MTAQILYLPHRVRFLVVNETAAVREFLAAEPLAYFDGSGGFWIDPDQLGPVVARLAERGVSLTIGAISSSVDEPEPPADRPQWVVQPGFTFVCFDSSVKDWRQATVRRRLSDPTRQGEWWEVETVNGYLVPMSKDAILAYAEQAWREGRLAHGRGVRGLAVTAIGTTWTCAG